MKTELAVLVVAVFTALQGSSVWAKPKPPAPCRVYFAVMEHDQSTGGLNMEGLNKQQEDWYRKHGDHGKWAGVCFTDIESAPAGAPLYQMLWSEHLAFTRGTSRDVAEGRLYIFNLAERKFEPVAPLYADQGSLNSPPTALLKHALEQIKRREKQRLQD